MPKRRAAGLPAPPYYLLIRSYTESVFVPGDERSKNAPGHGYPDETMTFDMNDLEVYDTLLQLTDAMTRLHKGKPGRTDLAALHVDSALHPETEFRLVRSTSPD